nr:hypothetical protein [Tanacetum cinerariifolium]
FSGKLTQTISLLDAYTASTPLSTVGPSRAFSDGELLYLDPSKYALPDDPLMPHLEDIYASPSEVIFTDLSYDDEGVVTDFNNLETTVSVSPTPATRIHTIQPKTQILRDLKSAVQTRSKVNKNSKAHALFQIKKVWILVDLLFGKKAIGTKWVYMNKKDERSVVVRNKARLVAQGHRQEEGIDYNEVFALVARIEAIRIFLAFASYMGFRVYQMDIKSAFLYGTINEEVYMSQPPGFVDPKFPNKVHKVVKALYGLHQASRACSIKKSWCDEFEELMKNRFQMSFMGELKEDVCACSRFQVTPKTLHLQVVKRIFWYHKGQLKLDLWYPKVSSFDLKLYSDSDYAGANLDKISTKGGCQFLGRRLISWQYKKQTIVATSVIEAEYNLVFHSKTKHIEIRHHFIRDTYEKKLIQVLKIHTNDNVADLLTKAFDVSSKELASLKKTALGKDISNPLMVGRFPKTTLPTRFEKTEPKNYTDDYLLKTLKTMFEQPDAEASVWRDHKGRYGLAKRYHLTHFTLEQMLNNVRLEVEEESEMSLELLRLVRRQLNEGIYVILEEDFDALLDEGSKILHSIGGTILKEEIFFEFDEFMAMAADENSESESDTKELPFGIIPINTDYKIKTSLEEPLMDLKRADNRPPMLEKDMYDSWKSIMELYTMNRQHGRMILVSVENGPLIWPSIEENGVTRPNKYSELSATEAIQADCDVKATNIILQGLPPEVYALFSNHRDTKELWERIQLLMQGTSLTKQEWECKLYDEFDKFSYKKRKHYKGGDPIDVINHMMGDTSLAAGTSRTYTSGASGNNFGKQRTVICYNCKGECHTSKQCTKPKRKGMSHGSRIRTSTHIDYHHPQCCLLTDELDAHDSDCDEINTAKVVLTENLSHCGSDDLADVHNHNNMNHNMINQAVQVMPLSEQSNIVNQSETEITSDSNIIPYSQYVNESQQAAVQNSNSLAQQDALILSKAQQLEPKLYDGNVIQKTNAIVIHDSEETLMLAEESQLTPSTRSTQVEVPTELPKVSMVNTSLKKLKHHLASFDVVVKERTTATAIIKGNACPLTRITTTSKVPLRKPIVLESNPPKHVVTLVYSLKPKASRKNFLYLDSDCSKHMTRDRSQLTNFVDKFLGTVKFGNDHVAKIMGYGDYQIGNVMISRVYFVDGIRNNLFSVGKFCDSDLEVAFRQHICFIRNLEDNGTAFVNQTLREYYEQVGISQETFVAWSPQQNDVVEKRNHTLIEADRTMLIYARALLFLWAEAVATACFTQNHSIIRLRHSKTPYELLHNKLPDLSYFHVFGALCYPTNDSEDLGKTRVKSYFFNTVCTTIKNRLGFVISPLFDELLTHPLSVDHPTPKVIAPIAKVVAPELTASTSSPSSTTVDQDATSPSNSQSTPETQPPIIPNDVEEDNHDIEVAYMSNDLYFSIPIPEATSDQS